MKKLLFSACIVFSAISLACSCQNKSGSILSGKDSISFDSIKVDSTLALVEGDAASPACHISLSITYAIGKNADYINDSIIRSGILSPDYFSISSEKLSIKETVDSFVSRYLSEYKNDYGVLYKADREHSASYNCEYLVSTYILQESDDYFTYVANIYNYGGGAHGSSVVITKNVNVKNGKIVALKDIFVPGFERDLNDIIVKYLCEQFKVKTLDALRQKTVFLGIDVYPPDNFIIGKKNITFIYSTDEIASHAIGEIRVKIDNNDLKDLFRK
ncbi:MAG: RsiV family protein [Prevotella sp.]|nr:RsiV family protein [Prevotella sp.]